MVDDRYLNRNPSLVPPTSRLPVAEVPGVARVYPRSRLLERFNDLHTANHFTSACSAVFYRDELLGETFAGNTFVCEPVHNLVHREVAYDDALRVRSRRADDEDQSEFLASTDHWFRPVMVRTGPDGALWVVDMYRHVIEHTEWIPDDYEARVDVRDGSEMGRIYRVVPVGTTPRVALNLAALDAAGLVAALDSPNGWQRDKAQQLLVERGGMDAVGALSRLARQASRPETRLQAMCTLDGLAALDGDLLRTLIDDPHPGVRRRAVRLSEAFLDEHSELSDAVIARADDPDVRVRLQVAYSLGECTRVDAGKALAEIALADAENEYVRAAVLSSAMEHVETLLAAVLEAAEPPSSVVDPLIRLAVEHDVPLHPLAEAFVRGVSPPPDSPPTAVAAWQLSALASLIETAEKSERTWRTLFKPYPRAIQAVNRLAKFAETAALDRDRSPAERAMALRLAAGGRSTSPDESLAMFADLLVSQEPRLVQQAARAALAASREEALAGIVLERWRRFGPAVRGEMLDLLLRRQQWTTQLVAALDDGRLPARELDATTRQRLLTHRESSIRDVAERVFAAYAANRAEALAKYADMARLEGHPQAGALVFQKKCSVCHQLGDQGHAIGPDLSALTDKSAAAMLAAILDPNRAVEAKFLTYTVVTVDGQTFTGLLAEESSNHITLLAQEGKRQRILRTALEEIESQGKSLMPEGLEQEIPPQAMADLIAFVQGSTATAKPMPGNRPELVQPERLRNELACLPTNAEIYGDTLVLEDTHSNLGFWQSENDHVVWTIDVPVAGEYLVFLEWACDDSVEGNTAAIEVADQRLNVHVRGTGDWNQYRREVVGRVQLQPGQHRIGVRAVGRIEGFLFDFKSLTLRPTS